MRSVFLSTFLTLVMSQLLFGQKVKFGVYGEGTMNQSIVSKIGSDFEEVSSENNFGFGLGTAFHFKYENRFSFRLITGLGYSKETVVFENAGQEKLSRGSIFIKTPLHALIKIGKSDLKFVAGFTPSISLAGGEDENNELNFKAFDASGDVGLNYSFHTGKMIICPELKYSYSLVDGLEEGSSVFNESIDSYFKKQNYVDSIFVMVKYPLRTSVREYPTEFILNQRVR